MSSTDATPTHAIDIASIGPGRAARAEAEATCIEVKDLSLFYGEKQALHGINMVIPRQRVTAYIGPSGCGKSTVLRLIAGLVRPDGGQILFEGTALDASNITALRRRMGYVIQEGGLFPHLTAGDNVSLMARFLGWEPARVDRRLGELAQLVHLAPHLLQRFPAELSGGQRQRISLMRALMLDPDLLLLDEPLGALDPMIRYELQQELKSIFQRLQKTVLLVTHDIAEAAFFSRRLVLMRQGRIVQQGSLDELVRSPAEPFVERFITAQRGPLRVFHEVLS